MSPPDQAPCRVRNDLFNAREGFTLGRSKAYFALWYLVKCAFFLSPLPWPRGWKRGLLRFFGAKVGPGVYIKPRVNVHIPWNLSIGAYAWIGEEVCIINFAPVEIGAHTCVSQRVFLCSGSHDYKAENMRYRHAPISVEDGVWIGAQVFVGPGVTLGKECVVTAGSVATKSLPAAMVCSGHPAMPIRSRWT